MNYLPLDLAIEITKYLPLQDVTSLVQALPWVPLPKCALIDDEFRSTISLVRRNRIRSLTFTYPPNLNSDNYVVDMLKCIHKNLTYLDLKVAQLPMSTFNSILNSSRTLPNLHSLLVKVEASDQREKQPATLPNLPPHLTNLDVTVNSISSLHLTHDDYQRHLNIADTFPEALYKRLLPQLSSFTLVASSNEGKPFSFLRAYPDSMEVPICYKLKSLTISCRNYNFFDMFQIDSASCVERIFPELKEVCINLTSIIPSTRICKFKSMFSHCKLSFSGLFHATEDLQFQDNLKITFPLSSTRLNFFHSFYHMKKIHLTGCFVVDETMDISNPLYNLRELEWQIAANDSYKMLCEFIQNFLNPFLASNCSFLHSICLNSVFVHSQQINGFFDSDRVRFDHLKVLKLTKVKIDCIKSCIRLKNLEHGTADIQDWFTHFSHLAPNLKHLNMDGVLGFNDECFNVICCKMPTLLALRLVYDHSTGTACKNQLDISKLLKLRYLKYLNIVHCWLNLTYKKTVSTFMEVIGKCQCLRYLVIECSDADLHFKKLFERVIKDKMPKLLTCYCQIINGRIVLNGTRSFTGKQRMVYNNNNPKKK